MLRGKVMEMLKCTKIKKIYFVRAQQQQFLTTISRNSSKVEKK